MKLLKEVMLNTQVKLWLLPNENDLSNLSDAVTALPVFPRRVENVLWNPQADGILAVTSHTTVKIYNVTGAAGREVFGRFDVCSLILASAKIF